MTRIRVYCCSALFLGCLCGRADAEKPRDTRNANQQHQIESRNSAPPQRRSNDYWLRTAQEVMAQLTSDEQKFEKSDLAILHARLCQVWWHADRGTASPWCGQSADEITTPSQNENNLERQQRFRTGTVVLGILGSLDQNARKRIVDSLRTILVDLKTDSLSRSRRMLAGALASAAMTDESSAAADVISDSLSVGGSIETMRAIIALQQENPEQASTLFRHAVSQIESNDDVTLAAALSQAIFPTGEAQNTIRIPEEWRQITQRLLVTLALRTRTSPLPTSLAAEVNRLSFRYSPDEITQLRTVVRANPPSATSSAVMFSGDLTTCDQFLEAAANAKDLRTQTQLKFEAAHAANKEDNLERALSILDEFSQEQRNANKYAFLQVRQEFASGLAVRSYIEGDVEKGDRTLDDCPKELEIPTALQVSRALLTRKPSEANRALLRARDAMSRREADNPADYISLVNQSFRLKRADVDQMLSLSLRSLDRWKPKEPEAIASGDVYFAPLDLTLAPLPFDDQVVEIDENLLSGLARETHTIKLRASFQLRIIQAALSRYRREQQTPRGVKQPVGSQEKRVRQ